MPKFSVRVSREFTGYTTGYVEVEAESEETAQSAALERITLEGNDAVTSMEDQDTDWASDSSWEVDSVEEDA